MTFESMIESNANENPVATEAPKQVASGEALSIKVFFGNDIRRATFNGNTYAALCDLCAKLYNLDLTSTVLKYQDSDDDKITMSSDNELQEAIKLLKDKTLRVHVEAKAPAIPPAEEGPAALPYGGAGYDWRGPFRGGRRGGFRGGFGDFPHHGRCGGFPQRGGHLLHPHAFPLGGPLPHHPDKSTTQSFGPVQTTQVDSQNGDLNVNHSTARVFGHGVFSPADSMSHCRSARADASPYPRDAWNDRKYAMKEQIKYMRQTAITEEDRQAVKIFKQQICEEWKEAKKAEKKQRKSEKKDKKDKKEKKDKKDKKDKCGKDKQRLIARHVADVTIPDNSELPADTPVTKTWRLRNAGTVAWPEDSHLVFISRRGDDLNGPERVLVGAVDPQQEVEVSVPFVTPSESGRYIGYYRMAAGNGAKFGQRVWVSFIIPERNNAGVPDVAQAPAQVNETSAPTADLLDVTME